MLNLSGRQQIKIARNIHATNEKKIKRSDRFSKQEYHIDNRKRMKLVITGSPSGSMAWIAIGEIASEIPVDVAKHICGMAESMDIDRMMMVEIDSLS